ncbi:hypothetical protein D3C77_761950 [compost metagenome]
MAGVCENGAEVRHLQFAGDQQSGGTVFTAAHADDVVFGHRVVLACRRRPRRGGVDMRFWGMR